MSRAFIDCTAQFYLRHTYLPCELPYLHDGDHQVTLDSCTESRAVFYGNVTYAKVDPIVFRWKPAHDDYTYHETAAEWKAAQRRKKKVS